MCIYKCQLDSTYMFSKWGPPRPLNLSTNSSFISFFCALILLLAQVVCGNTKSQVSQSDNDLALVSKSLHHIIIQRGSFAPTPRYKKISPRISKLDIPCFREVSQMGGST